jgi:hypothetical protein
MVYGKKLKPISGDLSLITFDTVQQYYWVKDNIEVPLNKFVKIPEGVVFLFEAEASLHINGNCSIEGSGKNPVFLTSIKDTTFPVAIGKNPSCFDWEGVVIGKSANVVFRNVHFRYAISPIEADSACSNITLDRVIRFKTMKDHFTINGKSVKVDNPFSYMTTPSPAESTVVHEDSSVVFNNTGLNTDNGSINQDNIPSAISVVPVPPSPQKQVPWYKTGTLKWTIGGTGIAAALASGGCAIGYYVNDQRYKKEHDIYWDPSNEDIDRKISAKINYLNAIGKRDDFKSAAVISGITAVVLLAGFGVTFFF